MRVFKQRAVPVGSFGSAYQTATAWKGTKAPKRPAFSPVDCAMYTVVKVGTPPQELTTFIDTGSSGLWLPSGSCATCARAGSLPENKLFHSGRSTTAETLTGQGESLDFNPVHFGAGAMRCRYLRDIACIAGFCLERQEFCLIKEEKIFSVKHSWDGILGLALRPEDENKSASTTLFSSLQTAGIEPVFTMVPGSADEANILIGSGAMAKFMDVESLAWVTVTSAPRWLVTARVGLKHYMQRNLLIDTGTLKLQLPPNDFLGLVRELTSGQAADSCSIDDYGPNVVCNCSATRSMPPLKFFFGAADGEPVSLWPEDLWLQAQDSPLAAADLKCRVPGTCSSDMYKLGRELCILMVGVTPQTLDDATWVLGDIFFRKTVVALDFRNRRAGFARPAANGYAQHTTTTKASKVNSTKSARNMSDVGNTSDAEGAKTGVSKLFGDVSKHRSRRENNPAFSVEPFLRRPPDRGSSLTMGLAAAAMVATAMGIAIAFVVRSARCRRAGREQALMTSPRFAGDEATDEDPLE